VRALARGDRDRLAALFERLSPASRLARFFTPKRALSSSELTFFTDVDQVRHAALAAVDPGDCSIVGVARYVVYGQLPVVAEVAVEVADDFQRTGVGTLLMTSVIERAAANRVGVLTARARYENAGARSLLRRLGFRAVAAAGGETCWRLELEPSVARRPG
jgi:GNAT superfamily N-acetyltransferase